MNELTIYQSQEEAPWHTCGDIHEQHLECATSTGKFDIPFFFSTVNEVEDGMPAIWVEL